MLTHVLNKSLGNANRAGRSRSRIPYHNDSSYASSHLTFQPYWRNVGKPSTLGLRREIWLVAYQRQLHTPSRDETDFYSVDMWLSHSGHIQVYLGPALAKQVCMCHNFDWSSILDLPRMSPRVGYDTGCRIPRGEVPVYCQPELWSDNIGKVYEICKRLAKHLSQVSWR